MKSHEDLVQRLRRQWDNAETRAKHLLGETQWPLRLSIGKPEPSQLRNEIGVVRVHLEQWRQVKCGRVLWESVRFKSAGEPVEIPVYWQIEKPSQWIDACVSNKVSREFSLLSDIMVEVDSIYHEVLVRRRSLWRDKKAEEVIQAARLTGLLESQCAHGKPLRALSLAGIDSKFFERNRTCITTLLDVRFDGEASRQGLEAFLGALNESECWLLVVDLDGALLPFHQLRVRSSELGQSPLPGKRLLIVENERCVHQLPSSENTLAILGSGLNLTWLNNPTIRHKKIAYWGDMDTWGLWILSRAREHLPQLSSLMMEPALFDQYADKAVEEPVVASIEPPSNLLSLERQFYEKLLSVEKGRLEQEFIPSKVVKSALANWLGC